jgi:lipopolysaccharide transport system permease protein
MNNKTALNSWTANSVYLKDLLLVLTQKEIKLRYQNTWLGYAWSVANPLAFALIYFIAFGIFMRVEIPHYPLFLIAGLFPWHWLAHSISAAPNIFLANATLIKKVRFPSSVLVTANVLNAGIHFVLSFPVILGFLLVYHFVPSWSWLFGIPLLVLAQFMMVYGIALAVASLNLFFRDLDRLVSLLVTFLFFLTPIAYSSSMIPAQYHAFMYLNPVAPLMLSWQQLFLDGNLNWPLVAASYFYAIVALALGSLIYQKLSFSFAEVL